MKSKLYIVLTSLILILLINICIPLWSNSQTTATVYLTSNKDTIEKGEEVEISFHIKNQKTAAYFITIYFDETKLEWVSGPENIKVEENQVKILWHDKQGGKGAKEGKLGKIILKAKEEGLANLVIDGEFFSAKEQFIQTNFQSAQIQIGKEETNLGRQAKEEQGNDSQTSNSNLKAMRINQEGIVPDFATDIYQYDLTVPNHVNEIEVLATSENPNAQVEVTGNTRIKTRIKCNKHKSDF